MLIYRAVPIKLSESLMKKISEGSIDTIELLANNLTIGYVALNEHPECIIDSQFYPFQYSSNQLDLSNIDVPLNTIKLVARGTSEETIIIQKLSDKPSKVNCDYLIKYWDGKITVLRQCGGCFGFPVI